MTTSKVKFISDFFSNNHTEDDFFRDRFFKVKLHALFNCLNEQELKSLFLSQLSQENEFSGSVLDFIVKKLEAKQLDFHSIAKDLIDRYPSQPYKVQLSYRAILSTIIKYLDKELVLEYFSLFINSQRINDRKKAFEIAEIIWDDVEDTVWKSFLKFKDEKALMQIINYFTPTDLLSNLPAIWEKDFPKNMYKMLILQKTVKSDISHFKFLMTTEPTFYIQALRLRNFPIEAKFLKSVVKEMVNENNGFVFYYIGLAKNWNLLIQTLESMKTSRFEE